MAKLTIRPWLTVDEMAERAAGCATVTDRRRWEGLALAAGGASAKSIASELGVCERSVRRWVELYNRTGDDACFDRRSANGHQRRVLSVEQEAALPELLVEPAPDGGQWTAAKLSAHLTATTGRAVSPQLAAVYARRQGFHLVRPRRTPVLPAASPGRRRRFRPPPPPPSHPHRRAYPSDLTDAEWEVVAPLVSGPAATGRPAKWSPREILDAIFYQARAGCAWRLLPHDLPPWKTVYYWFRRWRQDGTWERLNQVLRERVRVKQGREPEPSAAILDSQSAKTTEKGGSAATTRGRR